MTYRRPWMLTTILVALFSGLSAEVQAQKNVGPFSLEIQGFSKDIPHIKLKAEYEMAKNTSYCRGIRMPAPSGEWNCETIGSGVEK